MTEPWELFFDGACEPTNPGGWMVWAWAIYRDGFRRDAKAGVIQRKPENTNNVAEYLALLNGLIRAAEMKKQDGGAPFPGIYIRGDSQLVCKQIELEWQVNVPRLQKAHAMCLEQLKILAPYDIAWIPREQNAEADELGRKAYAEVVGKQMPIRKKRAPN